MMKKLITCNQSGQSFMEFIFLMITMMFMAFILLKGVNTGVADRWVKLVTMITKNEGSPALTFEE